MSQVAAAAASAVAASVEVAVPAADGDPPQKEKALWQVPSRSKQRISANTQTNQRKFEFQWV